MRDQESWAHPRTMRARQQTTQAQQAQLAVWLLVAASGVRPRAPQAGAGGRSAHALRIAVLEV